MRGEVKTEQGSGERENISLFRFAELLIDSSLWSETGKIERRENPCRSSTNMHPTQVTQFDFFTVHFYPRLALLDIS